MKCRLMTRGTMMVVLGLGCLAFCGEHNSASGFVFVPVTFAKPMPWWLQLWKQLPSVPDVSEQALRQQRQVTPSLTKVKVPYTYYVWETRTSYRLVTKPVTTTSYRYEWRTTQERYRDWRGQWKMKRQRKLVKVPFKKTVYKKVRQQYTDRVRVKKTGYRYEYRNNQTSL